MPHPWPHREPHRRGHRGFATHTHRDPRPLPTPPRARQHAQHSHPWPHAQHGLGLEAWPRSRGLRTPRGSETGGSVANSESGGGGGGGGGVGGELLAGGVALAGCPKRADRERAWLWSDITRMAWELKLVSLAQRGGAQVLT